MDQNKKMMMQIKNSNLRDVRVMMVIKWHSVLKLTCYSRKKWVT